MPDVTTVEVTVETWQRLKDRKQNPEQSFDDVIVEALDATESAHAAHEPT